MVLADRSVTGFRGSLRPEAHNQINIFKAGIRAITPPISAGDVGEIDKEVPGRTRLAPALEALSVQENQLLGITADDDLAAARREVHQWLGHKPKAAWVEHNLQVDSTLRRTHGFDFERNGVHKLPPLSSEDAMRLHSSLTHGFEAADQGVVAGVRGGELVVFGAASDDHEVFSGYNTYSKVLGTFNSAKQAKVTTVLDNDRLGYLRKNLDGFDAFVKHCDQYAKGLQLSYAHVLRQGSRQAIFDWHQDTEQRQREVLTFITLLSNTDSGMQVAGHDTVHYDGVGETVVFGSDKYHRSVHLPTRNDKTVKVALFYNSDGRFDEHVFD